MYFKEIQKLLDYLIYILYTYTVLHFNLSMNYSYQIKDLDSLIKQYFGDAVNLINYEAKPLTSKGENYGSEMLDLEMKLERNDNIQYTLKVVAKMCPPNEMLKEVFDTAVTFKKEINAYNTVLPTLLKFQEENCGKTCEKIYAECFASRFSLNSNSDVDDDAIILLENLKLSQYDVANRMEGFSLDQTELVLEALSTLQAVPIALKMKNPDLFNSNILSHLSRNRIFDIVDAETENVDVDFVLQTAEADERCKIYKYRIDEAMRTGLKNHREFIGREPYATISHNDFWVNNIMLKSNERKCKIVDFQLMDYDSCVNDLLFFIFTSVQEDVLNENLDYLIRFYYDELLRKLTELKCDTKLFTFDSFMKEVDFYARNKQFYHIMVMLRLVFAIKEKTKTIREVTMEDFSSNDRVSPECTRRVITTILHFVKNNWI
ncbi:hypothetical protein FQR65_LT00593 [Abscondita terminalis]|nr:hypothetical protein FQR65_LT00593 [Abscondita terminalis]